MVKCFSVKYFDKGDTPSKTSSLISPSNTYILPPLMITIIKSLSEISSCKSFGTLVKIPTPHIRAILTLRKSPNIVVRKSYNEGGAVAFFSTQSDYGIDGDIFLFEKVSVCYQNVTLFC